MVAPARMVAPSGMMNAACVVDTAGVMHVGQMKIARNGHHKGHEKSDGKANGKDDSHGTLVRIR